MDFDLIESLKINAEKLNIPFFKFLDERLCNKLQEIDGNIVWVKEDKGSKTLLYKYVVTDVNADLNSVDWSKSNLFNKETDHFLKKCSQNWVRQSKSDNTIVFRSGDFLIVGRSGEVAYKRLNSKCILLESEGKKLLVTKMGD